MTAAPQPSDSLRFSMLQLLQAVVEKGASDLHLTAGTAPLLRIAHTRSKPAIIAFIHSNVIIRIASDVGGRNAEAELDQRHDPGRRLGRIDGDHAQFIIAGNGSTQFRRRRAVIPDHSPT